MTTKARPENLQPGDPRAIVRWAQRYAKSRTISFLVQWVIIVSMVAAIGIAASLTNIAYRSGGMSMFYASIAAMGMAILALTWFSMSKWSGELIWRVTQWLYGQEGYVAYLGDRDDGPTPWWITALGGGLVVYHLVGAIFVSFGYLQLKNMQPYSAAYMAPFLIVMIVYQRLGLWAWIWPILYGLHGVLLFYGAPISFPRQWYLLNMIVPVFGYGLVAILAGHAYSRFALYKLKSLTRPGLLDSADAGESGREPSDDTEGRGQ